MQIVRLRDLIVLSGAIRRVGGSILNRRDTTSQEKAEGYDVVETQQSRRISQTRRKADTFVVSYSRRLRKSRLLVTPFGALYDPAFLNTLQAMLADMTKKAMAFNAQQGDCKISNCLLWEPLRDNRKAAIEGWITRQVMDGDQIVQAALPKLLKPAEQLSDLRV